MAKLLERTYVIPLRKETHKVAKYLRTRKAVKAARSFLQKHMKVEDVRLGMHLNLQLWARGNRYPPHKVEVLVEKMEEDGNVYAYAELVGAPREEKKTAKKSLTEKLKEKVVGKKEMHEGHDHEVEARSMPEEKKEVASEEEKELEKEGKEKHKKEQAPKIQETPTEQTMKADLLAGQKKNFRKTFKKDTQHKKKSMKDFSL